MKKLDAKKYMAAAKELGCVPLHKVKKVEQVFCTSFCNFGHRLSDGKPVNHECYILNPAALQAERDGDYEKALELMHGKRIVHRGLKR